MIQEVVALIEGNIRLDWSPGQVSGRLSAELGIAISHWRIYQHAWTDNHQGGGLHKRLRHSRYSNSVKRSKNDFKTS